MDWATFLNNLITLGTGRQWLPLAALVVFYLTLWTSDWSRFPWNPPDWAKPLIVLGLGQIAGILKVAIADANAGVPTGEALLHGAWVGLVVSGGAIGIFVAVVKVIYKGEVPPWLKLLAFAKKPPSDGGGAGAGPYRTSDPPKKEEIPPPPAAARMAWVLRALRPPRKLLVGLALVLVVYLSAACSWFQSHPDVKPPTPDAVACVYGEVVVKGVTDPQQIQQDCPQVAAWALSDLIAIINGLVMGKQHEAAAHAPRVTADGGK